MDRMIVPFTAPCSDETSYRFLDSRTRTRGFELSLAVNITFACSGAVRAWKYQLITPTNATSFHLQVWRFIGGTIIERVGSSLIHVEEDLTTVGGRTVYWMLDAEDQIPVEPGYFIALYAEQTSEFVPFASRGYNTLEQDFQSEIYTYSTNTNLVQVDLRVRDIYRINSVANVGAITGD